MTGVPAEPCAAADSGAAPGADGRGAVPGAGNAGALPSPVGAAAGPLDPPDGARPLSPAQLPIWHAEMLHRGTPRWTQQCVTILDGPVDRARLDRALSDAVVAFPALRLRILRRGASAWQAFRDPAGFAAAWHEVDGTEEARADWIAAFLAAGERRRFPLDGGWLFAVDLLACAPQRVLMVCRMHHVVADGTSYAVFLRHVGDAYRGAAPPVENPGYGRWLDRQARPGPDPALDAAVAFYRGALAGAAAPPDPPWDDAAPAFEPPDLPERRCVLPPSVVDGLARLAGRTASTLFVACLAAYGAALAEALDAPDLVVGVYVSGRGGETGLVAMATNLLLVRLRLDPADAPATLVRAAREAWRPVRRLEAVPIHAVRRRARETAGGSGAGAIPDRVRVAVNFLDLRAMACDLPGVASTTLPPNSAVPVNDLLLLVFRAHDGLHLRLINGSGTGRLDEARIGGLLERVRGTMEAWAAQEGAGAV